ncbi:MAG: hypothetical protein ACKVTZ_17430 [Bacteroidia bacterium]
MTTFRELPFLSKLLILCGGFYVQFGLAFFCAGIWTGVLMSNVIPNEAENAPWAVFITPVVFSLVGGGLSVAGVLQNLKALQLLQYGVFTTGTLKQRDYTNTKINNVPVIKFTFEFRVNNLPYEVIGKTHEHNLLTEQTERIIYNPENPKFSILYDLIPNAPKLIDNSQLEPVPAYRAYLLILPAIALAGLYFLVPF